MSRAPYDAEDLRLFALIHAAGSLSAAERRFGIPKSSLSRALARLERAAGVALFDRMPTGLKPTALANELLTFGVNADSAVKSADEVLRAASEKPSGKLVIAASATSSRFLISGALARFITLHPAVDVRLEVTGDAPDPQTEGIDLALQVGWPDKPALVARRVISGPTGLYVSPGVELADWSAVAQRGRIVISARDAPQAWRKTWMLRRGNDEFVLSGRPLASVGDPSIALDLLAAGCGVALLPVFFAAPLVRSGQLERALPEWHGPLIELFAVLPPGRRQVAAVRQFMNLLLEAAQLRNSEAERAKESLVGPTSGP